jgi:hypothetical protein
MPEDYIETKRSWVHRFRKHCPHCNLPLDIEIDIPFTHPQPTLKLKGGVKAKSAISINVPALPPPRDDDEKEAP